MILNYEDYLGDGVYVKFDGYSVVLRTQREHGWDEIYLDNYVLDSFLRYIDNLKKELEKDKN